MIKSLINIIIIVMILDMFIFFNFPKRYDGYLTFNHYKMALKNKTYQNILIMKIIFFYIIFLILSGGING